MQKEKQKFFQTAEYIRLSREDGDKAESDSIGNQKKLIADFLKNKPDFVLYDTYVDDGFTGTNFNRPAFKRMLADIETGKINCVVVKDLSRFGRDYIDTGKYLERYFPEHDIRFISITDNIDSQKQTYDMLLPIKNIFNEQYARDISKKVHASMQTKQKAGEFIGAFASYGYQKSPADKNKLVIDAYAAGIVRRIFDMYISGCGKNSIAITLNREGVVCPSEYKKINGENYKNSNKLESTSYWTYSTVNRLLQNEMYAGNMVQGRKTQHMGGKQRALGKEDWIVVKNTHEAIIDSLTWEKAQELLKRRVRNPDLNSNRSIFAGFLKCGDCGRALVKKAGTSKKCRSLINYYCGSYVRSGRQYCTPHSVPHSVLEKIILEDLKTIIQKAGELRKMVEQYKSKAVPAHGKEAEEKKRLNMELQRVRKLKKAVYEDYREELISKEEFLVYRENYMKRERLIEKQLETAEGEQAEGRMPDVFEIPWIKHLLEFGTVEKLDREIIVEMIHEIQVFDTNKIKIIYNFSAEGELQPSSIALQQK